MANDARPDVISADSGPRKRGLGLLSKITLFLALILVPLGLVTWYLSTQTFEQRLESEFTSKGVAVATGLGAMLTGPISSGDVTTVQSTIDQFLKVQGVDWILVYDPQKNVLAHTFTPNLPPELIDKNPVPGDVPVQVRKIVYVDPKFPKPKPESIIDVGVPILAGKLGTVRVGMAEEVVSEAVARSSRLLLLISGGAAVLAIGLGFVFARGLTHTIGRMVRVAEQVGRGDLSELVPVTSGDELGQLGATFNESIVRLRVLVQTESERDEERRRREELQGNVMQFLDTTMQVVDGDLTKRGEVTGDVLGNVVDAINLLLDELSAVLSRVRQAANRVNVTTTETISSTRQMAAGARAQAQEAVGASSAVEALTASVRKVAEDAGSAAGSSREALQAAERGEAAVRDTLAGMQRIRAQVQTISKRTKSLGDRSLEISDIVNTIGDIASQTNLLALNAAIEAAGAGEAGLRFAVVADEVRKLAERSSTATRDIAELIRSVQREIHDAGVAMEDGAKEVESGHQLALQAEASLKDIAQISRTAAGVAQEISQATQQQVLGADGVASAIHSIADVATQTEKGVTQTQQMAEDLAKVAEELTTQLAKFKLPA